MINCGKISANLTLASCASVSTAVEPEVILLNHSDIEEVTEADGVISAIVLQQGASGYKYLTFNRGVEANATGNKGTYLTRFSHQVIIRVFAKSQDIKDQINALVNARVVAVVKNVSNADAEVKYEVYGIGNGLVVTDLQATSTDADGVVYAITLASDDNALEAQLPASFFTTSAEATEAAVEALVTAQ